MNRLRSAALLPLAIVMTAALVGPLSAPSVASHSTARSSLAASYHITTKYDGDNIVTGSARDVGGSWYLLIQQRATPKDKWQFLAGGDFKGRAKKSAPQTVRGDGYDFHGYWRTCVTTNWQKPTAKTTCGNSIVVK